jgi:hypothetical protein
MDIFTIVVVRNFAVPGVTVSNGWLRSVDVTVSIVLAVKYVPPYRVYMSINGVERKKPLGFLIMSRRHVDNVCRIDIPLDAFSMIALFNNDVSALSFLSTYEWDIPVDNSNNRADESSRYSSTCSIRRKSQS